MARDYMETALGLLEIVADERILRRIDLVKERGGEQPNPVTGQVKAQLQEYFAGKRQQFSLAAMPEGTDFQQEVWQTMSRIPYGKVVTYGQLAAAMGRPEAVRAVANAVGKNPLLVLLPCHRVVAAKGLGGFSAGLEAKRKLLALEGVEITQKGPFSEKFLFTFEKNCATI